MTAAFAATCVLDEKVLVLNRLYTAVRVVSARRAFTLLCKRIAEVIAVAEHERRVHDAEAGIPGLEIIEGVDKQVLGAR